MICVCVRVLLMVMVVMMRMTVMLVTTVMMTMMMLTVGMRRGRIVAVLSLFVSAAAICLGSALSGSCSNLTSIYS